MVVTPKLVTVTAVPPLVVGGVDSPRVSTLAYSSEAGSANGTIGSVAAIMPIVAAPAIRTGAELAATVVIPPATGDMTATIWGIWVKTESGARCHRKRLIPI